MLFQSGSRMISKGMTESWWGDGMTVRREKGEGHTENHPGVPFVISVIPSSRHPVIPSSRHPCGPASRIFVATLPNFSKFLRNISASFFAWVS